MAKEDDPYEEYCVPNSMVGTIIGRGGEDQGASDYVWGFHTNTARIEMEPGQEGRRLTMRGSKEVSKGPKNLSADQQNQA